MRLAAVIAAAPDGGTFEFEIDARFIIRAAAALGIDLGIGLGAYVRYHFGVGTEWESEANYAARGFRGSLRV